MLTRLLFAQKLVNRIAVSYIFFFLAVTLHLSRKRCFWPCRLSGRTVYHPALHWHLHQNSRNVSQGEAAFLTAYNTDDYDYDIFLLGSHSGHSGDVEWDSIQGWGDVRGGAGGQPVRGSHQPVPTALRVKRLITTHILRMLRCRNSIKRRSLPPGAPIDTRQNKSHCRRLCEAASQSFSKKLDLSSSKHQISDRLIRDGHAACSSAIHQNRQVIVPEPRECG